MKLLAILSTVLISGCMHYTTHMNGEGEVMCIDGKPHNFNVDYKSKRTWVDRRPIPLGDNDVNVCSTKE